MASYLSQQALLAVAGYILVIVAVMLPAQPTYYDDPETSYNVSDRLLVILAMLIPMALSVYTINCLVVGSDGLWCDKWSWINAAIVFVWSVLIFCVSVYAMFVPLDIPTVEKFKIQKKN